MNHHPVDFLFTRNVEHYSMKDSIANDLKCNYGNKLKTVDKDKKNDLNKNYNNYRTNKNEENLQKLGDKIPEKEKNDDINKKDIKLDKEKKIPEKEKDDDKFANYNKNEKDNKNLHKLRDKIPEKEKNDNKFANYNYNLTVNENLHNQPWKIREKNYKKSKNHNKIKKFYKEIHKNFCKNVVGWQFIFYIANFVQE